MCLYRKCLKTTEIHQTNRPPRISYKYNTPVYSQHYMDGGFTNIQPLEDSSPTLTISPFAGDMDICPSDTSTILCDAIIQQLSFQCSVTNFIRLVDALFPRDWRVRSVTQAHLWCFFSFQSKHNPEHLDRDKELEHCVTFFLAH